MIFIGVGTQRFQFNRLLEEIDSLIDDGTIKDDVFAQIGYSTYKPRNYNSSNFLSQQDFNSKIKSCDIFITHGGVGAIHNGLSLKKKVIIYPRLAKYNEHVDDHQIEIATKYVELGFCLGVVGEMSLKDCILSINDFKTHYHVSSGDSELTEYILKYIDNN